MTRHENLHYHIVFREQDAALNQAGFDVCLAIVALELPLTISVAKQVIEFWRQQGLDFEKQLQSLIEFDEVIFNNNVDVSHQDQSSVRLFF